MKAMVAEDTHRPSFKPRREGEDRHLQVSANKAHILQSWDVVCPSLGGVSCYNMSISGKAHSRENPTIGSRRRLKRRTRK